MDVTTSAFGLAYITIPPLLAINLMGPQQLPNGLV